MKTVKETYDIVVIGGGMAGYSAALAAARQGSNTCLIHNRPVFGGNCSSEIGVTIHGAAAFHAYARETGIISELLIEERAANHAEIYENGWINSVWDIVMYDKAVQEKNLTFYLNTDMADVVLSDDKKKIEAVISHIQNAETELITEAKVFIDCTGDGIVADRAGCEWRMGSEGKEEFQEIHAPEKASKDTMGNSIHFRAKDMGRPVPFTAPDWAIKHDNPAYFYEQGRIPKDKRGGFWWLEIGVPYHTIYDNEDIRHELTRHTLGVWDWMKNHDPIMKEQTKNYALDWIGQVPGKRESRRIMGEYFMTENDIQEKKIFDDEVGFGGWFIDLHTPGGLLAKHAEASAASDGEEYDTFNEYSVLSYCGPYGFPLRSLIAKDIDNLMMAGRNLSSTHAALGTLRVMGTTALMGQATGIAAATSLEHNCEIKEIPTKHISEVQQLLLRDGCFLPNSINEDNADLALQAKLSSSSSYKVEGAGPDSPAYHEGLSIWKDQPQYKEEKLEVRKGQLIAIGSKIPNSFSVCLSNTSPFVQEIEIYIVPLKHAWDYRVDTGAGIDSGKIKIEAGEQQWIEWKLDEKQQAKIPLNQYIRLDIAANAEISWHEASCIVPGHTAMYQIGQDKMRRYYNGSTLSFKVKPAQDCYKAENVTSGITRPYQYTNLWKSEEFSKGEQWIELEWEVEKSIKQIELTFPGHILREYHAYAPFYRDPQCPKDYEIFTDIEDKWVSIGKVEDNYQRQNIVKLNKNIQSKKLRVQFYATNGDPCAAVYEIRVY